MSSSPIDLNIDAQSLGKVAVLFGGTSAERPVSLMSGHGVLDALRGVTPNAEVASASAASPMTMISNAPQPTSCTTFSRVGTEAPRSPRLGRSMAMEARPVSAPTTPTAASSPAPSSDPTRMAANASPRFSAGTSSAPACSTSRPMPRLNHKAKASRGANARWSAGTGVSGS